MNIKIKRISLLFNYDETRGYSISMPISSLTWFTSILPFSGFVFCVLWSLIYNFEETTFTHCKVRNYLPSISAAIGDCWTQYIVWCTTITLHAAPRFLFVAIYYRHNIKLLKHHHYYLIKVATVLNFIENASLMGLTYITSTKANEIHTILFVTFMISSEFYMFITCLMLKHNRKSTISVDKLEANYSYSIYLKTRLLVINVLSFLTAGYFFWRHNKYCETGIYSMFAFFEYIVVLSNIAFHLTALIDFKDKYITIYKHGIEAISILTISFILLFLHIK